MEIYKVLSLAIVIAILCFYLKTINSEYYVLALISGGIIILFYSIGYLSQTISIFQDFIDKLNIDKQILTLVIKITVTAYLIEFGISLIEDLGIKSLADKLSFAGKIILFCMSIPIFNCLAQVILQFLN